MLRRTLLLLSLISLFLTLRAHSADIDIKDYWMNTVGQWCRYTFSYLSSASLNQVNLATVSLSYPLLTTLKLREVL